MAQGMKNTGDSKKKQKRKKAPEAFESADVKAGKNVPLHPSETHPDSGIQRSPRNDTAHDLTIVLDGDLLCRYISPSMMYLLDPARDMMGKPLHDIVHTKDRGLIDDLLARSTASPVNSFSSKISA